uniref:Uncharacterized protein n=1 Tax=Picea glauca TaxID=3330 RepID=A0A101LVA7_PICGL|nr:hypothetical protein ABT39_MTgene2120 [Picea glauca]
MTLLHDTRATIMLRSTNPTYKELARTLRSTNKSTTIRRP